MGQHLFEIENFQSIEKASIVFDKFMVIAGPSNRGKSAVVRALRALLYNEWNPSYLRVDPETGKEAKCCTLTLVFPEDSSSEIHAIKLTKPENKYTVKYRDGRKDLEFPKTNKEVPKEIQDLGFGCISTEREDVFNLTFQGQLDPLFLLGNDPTGVATTSFFNSVFKISKYEGALRGLSSDSIKMNSEYKDIISAEYKEQEALAEITTELEVKQAKLKELKALYEQYQALCKQLEGIEQGFELFQKIEDLDVRIQEAQTTIALLGEMCQFLEEELVPKLEWIESAWKISEQLRDIEEKVKISKSLKESLGAFSEVIHSLIEKLSTQLEVLSLSSALEIAEGDCARFRMQMEFFGDFKVVFGELIEKLGCLEDVSHVWKRVSELETGVSQQKTALSCLEEFKKFIGMGIEVLEKTVAVCEMESLFTQVENKEASLKKEVDTAKTLQGYVGELLHWVIDTIEICPVCALPTKRASNES